MASNPVAWVLVFHLAGMVFWIGGLFMALAVAATAAAAGADEEPGARLQRARLAQKGMRSFAHPGAALMVITGALLIYLLPEVRMAGWLHAKLTLVAILIALDLVLTVQLRRMPGRELPPARLGMFHGTISLLFLLILVLVLVKPF